MALDRGAPGRGAHRQGRQLRGGHRARRRSGAARRERPVRGVRGHPRLRQGHAPAHEHVRRHPPQHDARLSRSSHQVGALRRLSRGLSAGAEDRPARDRRRRPGARERHDGRRRRRHPIPGAEMAREGRRPLYRHRHLHHHPRSGGELAQCRSVPRAGPRQEDRRHGDGRRSPRPHPPRQGVQARRAAAGRDGAGRRSDRLLLRRAGSALRRVRARPGRRPARPAGEDGARQGHRPPLPGQCRDRARRLRAARPHPRRRPVRRMDRTLRRRRARDPGARHQGDLLPQRSDPAGRAADGRAVPTRWRATAR